jgi:hypothetical protein
MCGIKLTGRVNMANVAIAAPPDPRSDQDPVPASTLVPQQPDKDQQFAERGIRRGDVSRDLVKWVAEGKLTQEAADEIVSLLDHPDVVFAAENAGRDRSAAILREIAPYPHNPPVGSLSHYLHDYIMRDSAISYLDDRSDPLGHYQQGVARIFASRGLPWDFPYSGGFWDWLPILPTIEDVEWMKAHLGLNSLSGTAEDWALVGSLLPARIGVGPTRASTRSGYLVASPSTPVAGAAVAPSGRAGPRELDHVLIGRRRRTRSARRRR